MITTLRRASDYLSHIYQFESRFTESEDNFYIVIIKEDKTYCLDLPKTVLATYTNQSAKKLVEKILKDMKREKTNGTLEKPHQKIRRKKRDK